MSIFRKLFREAGVKDVITLFHAPKNPASIRVFTLLKQTEATAHSTATQDQASSHDQQAKTSRTGFELEVREEDPTEDQLKSILEYAGESNANTVVEGASSVSDAIRKAQKGSNIVRPLVVDWNRGAIVTGDNESEILKLLKTLPDKSVDGAK